MKDLKHLYYFERLLDDANNELVRQAKEEGKKCIGSVCYQIPEVLLNLPGTFSVRPASFLPSLSSVSRFHFFVHFFQFVHCFFCFEKLL